jgi:hypothetical protein
MAAVTQAAHGQFILHVPLDICHCRMLAAPAGVVHAMTTDSLFLSMREVYSECVCLPGRCLFVLSPSLHTGREKSGCGVSAFATCYSARAHHEPPTLGWAQNRLKPPHARQFLKSNPARPFWPALLYENDLI